VDHKSVEELEILLTCTSALERIIVMLEAKETIGTKKTVTKKDVSYGRKEMTWTSRAIVIYFFLHPLLGKKDLQLTSEIFNVNKRTLEGWVSKEEQNWHGLVSNLSFDDVVEALPS